PPLPPLPFELFSHLDHRPPETSAIKQALCCRVFLCCREYHAWRTTRFERFKCRFDQHATDALAAMCGIDHDVVQHSGWTTQRHVVISLHARVGVCNHLTLALRDKDDDVRVRESSA